MDIDSEAQALLRQYESLPKSTRQAILRRILDELPSDGWREIKARADVHTLQYDILGKLPLEMAALVAEYLPLVDIIRLRRVSQRWQHVLSCPSLCRAAVRATLSKDPWSLSSITAGTIRVPETNMVSASTADPGHNITSYSAASFTKVVKRRHRLDQGDPYKTTTVSSPIEGLIVSEEPEYLDPRDFVTYSDGCCAWLDPKEDQTTVVILNLFNGERKTFTTDNREKLCAFRFSKPFIAAVSIRGYCHVWNIDTFESSSFRIPSLDFWGMMVSGTKVLLLFHGCLVYWCFDIRIARTVNMKTESILTLSLHPSEDQITIIRLCPKVEKKPWHSVPLQGCQLRIEKYAMDSRIEWCLLSSRYQQMSAFIGLEDGIHFTAVEDRNTLLYPGQYTVAMNIWKQAIKGPSRTSRKFCLSVEPDGLVAFHELPVDVHHLASPDRGVVYGLRFDRPSANIAVMKSKTTMGPENSWVRYDYYIQRTTPTWQYPWIIGDARFIIIFDEKKMDIWTMDEPDLEDQKAVD